MADQESTDIATVDVESVEVEDESVSQEFVTLTSPIQSQLGADSIPIDALLAVMDEGDIESANLRVYTRKNGGGKSVVLDCGTNTRKPQKVYVPDIIRAIHNLRSYLKVYKASLDKAAMEALVSKATANEKRLDAAAKEASFG